MSFNGSSSGIPASGSATNLTNLVINNMNNNNGVENVYPLSPRLFCFIYLHLFILFRYYFFNKNLI